MVGEYPLDPDRIKEWGDTFDIMVSTPALAREARRARNATGNQRKSYTLLHDHISFAEKELLIQFFEDRRGQWDSFTWTQPAAPVGDGSVLTVRFAQDTMVVEKPLGYSVNPRFRIKIKVIEVL